MTATPETILQPTDVASFTASIITFQGNPVGTCIKFRHFDQTESLLHVQPRETNRLLGAINQYMEQGRHQSLMLKFYENPALAQDLSTDHPYNTLLNMTPKMSEDEAGTARKATSVEESSFADQESVFVYRVRYADGGNAEFKLHECIAFNLFGFIFKMQQDNAILGGAAGGTA